MNPVRHIYSAIVNGEEELVLGGIIHSSNDTFAKLLYIAPSSQVAHPDLPELLENLSAQAGAWGAFHVLAEVDETSDVFIALRRAGFSVYAWQRMWDVSNVTATDPSFEWMRVRSVHLPSVQSLYHQIVPPLLQPIEPQPKIGLGWMCNEGMKCYVSATQGAYGIVLAPLIHPEANSCQRKTGFLDQQFTRPTQPAGVCLCAFVSSLAGTCARGFRRTGRGPTGCDGEAFGAFGERGTDGSSGAKRGNCAAVEGEPG